MSSAANTNLTTPTSSSAIPPPADAYPLAEPSADEVRDLSAAFVNLYAQFSTAKHSVLEAQTVEKRAAALNWFVQVLVSVILDSPFSSHI